MVLECACIHHRETCLEEGEHRRTWVEDKVTVLSFARLLDLRHDPECRLEWDEQDLKHHFQIPQHHNIKLNAGGTLTYKDNYGDTQALTGLRLHATAYSSAFRTKLRKWGGM